MTPEKEQSIRDRLVEIGDCLRWKTGAKTANRRRHPLVLIDGKVVLVRRVLYELERGPIRPTMFLVPTCGDECCIAPAHQKQITKKQKNDLGAQRAANAPGRAAKVAATVRASGRPKLSIEAAREIRNSDESIPVLAVAYGVDEKSIWNVRQGITWKELANPFAGIGARP